MHSSRVAAAELALAGLLAVLWHDSVIQKFGPIFLPVPVSALLVIPALGATAAATAGLREHNVPLPDPTAARLARVGWGVVWLVLASVVALLGTLIAGDGLAPALVRNTAIYYAMACLLSRAGGGQFIWIGPLGYMLAAMLFGAGFDSSAYRWWAVVLSEHASGAQLVVAGALAAVALASRAATPK